MIRLSRAVLDGVRATGLGSTIVDAWDCECMGLGGVVGLRLLNSLEGLRVTGLGIVGSVLVRSMLMWLGAAAIRGDFIGVPPGLF